MEISSELAEAIVRHVHAADYRPCKPKQILLAMGLPEDQYREVRRTVKWLVQRGQLEFGAGHLVRRCDSHAGQPKDIVRGTFSRAQAGFGFIRQSAVNGTAEPLEDIFVPEGRTGDALQGDLVEARIRKSANRSRGGVEGHIERVIERARRQFSGTYVRKDNENLVFVDGTHLTEPIRVGDTRGLPVKSDDKVVVEIVHFPDAGGSGGEGVIIEVLGNSRNPAVDTLAVMRQYGLPAEFPSEVIAAARQQADKFVEAIPEDRRDLTHLPTLTIDPFDARDFDDAISLEVIENDHWLLRVHIADVSYFIPAGSVLDQDAKQRATSVYLPDRVVPMIPEIISNHLASLQPERIRFAKTVEMEFTATGSAVSTEVFNSAIRSDCRLNYDQVDQFLADSTKLQESAGQVVCDLLERMHALAMILRKRRMDNGSIEMDLPEIKIKLDQGGKVKGAFLVEHTESHQIIEEFMLAANQAVATWLDDMKLLFLRRIHPNPDRRKLRHLARFLKDLGLDADKLESRQSIRQVLRQVKNSPLHYAVNYAVLKAMNKATYGPIREGHYALAFEHYCHFTSPIRRYPDLTVHRLVDKISQGIGNPSEPLPIMMQLGHHCSDQEKNAEAAERELIRIKLLHYMSKRIGDSLDAVITRVHPDGLYARGIELPAEGYVPLDNLPGDQYRFESRGQCLEGFREGNQFRLGDRVVVQVESVNMQQRELTFSLIKNLARQRDPLPSRSSMKKTKKRKDKRSRKKKR